MKSTFYQNWSNGYNKKYVKNKKLLFERIPDTYLKYDKLPHKALVEITELYKSFYKDTIEICKNFLNYNAVLYQNELQTVRYFMYAGIMDIGFYQLYRGFQIYGNNQILPKKYFGRKYIKVLKALDDFFNNQIEKEASYVLEC